MRALAWLTLAGTLLAAGCKHDDANGGAPAGDSAGTAAASSAPVAAPAPPPSPAPPAANQGTQAVVELAPVGGSGMSGELTAVSGGATSTLTLRIAGAPASASVVAHVHYGRCAQPGNVTAPLTPIDTRADGTGSSTTEVTIAMSTLMDGGHFVQAHKPDGTPAACADLPKQG
jgi:hypothetical protein